MAVLGLHYCSRAFYSCGGLGLLWLQWLLLLHSMDSTAYGFSSCCLRALERGLSSYAHGLVGPCGIFLDYGLNPGVPCFSRQIPNHWTISNNYFKMC